MGAEDVIIIYEYQKEFAVVFLQVVFLSYHFARARVTIAFINCLEVSATE
jgi:hypothetical protein